MLVVTGASGLLGLCVLRSALELGWEAVGLCHRHVIRDPAMRIVGFDLTDEAAIRKLLFELRPDVLVHCAAATNVDWCEDHPAQVEAINVQATAVLAEIAATLNARFVYVSTDSVFDGRRGNYLETDEPAPLNVYAQSKLAGEQETVARHPQALIVRVCIYGWNAQNKESLAEWVLNRLEAGSTVSGFTDVFFTPILVNDLAPLLNAMLQRELSGLYHVGGSERISKFEFAQRVARTFGLNPRLVIPSRISDTGLRATRPLDISLNTQKIRNALRHSMPDVDSGLNAFRELRRGQYPQQLKGYLGSNSTR